MPILDDLLNAVRMDGRVEEVLVGAHWTMVRVRVEGRVLSGMAATALDDAPHGEAPVRDAGRLHLRTARELAEYARSPRRLEASIGVATLNALLARDPPPSVELNAADWLEAHGRGRRVALVGHFPFIARLRSVASALWVIEQRPVDDEIDAAHAAEFLARADVVAITGMTLVNHTLDDLLRACRADAHVMLLGPSTPLTPRLFDYGIEVLSGAQIVDVAAARLGIAQGAGLRQLDGVRLVTLTRG
jgi:uncharacterized protein (DUF4213/DUF364 family)